MIPPASGNSRADWDAANVAVGRIATQKQNGERMFCQHPNRTAVGVVALAALLSSAAAVAQNPADRDLREISSYVLTDAGLAKYTQAVKNLGPLARGMDSCAEGDDDSDSANSLDETAARIDAIPGVHAAIKAAGMTTREYLVFTFSLFQNGMGAWALEQPGGKLPPGMSMENVKFYRAHEDAIKQLSAQTKATECDGGEGEDEAEDNTQ
jgi:hypothetical protein